MRSCSVRGQQRSTMQPISSAISTYLRRAASLPNAAAKEILSKELLSPWLLVDALKIPVGALDNLAAGGKLESPVFDVLPGELKGGDGSTTIPHAQHHEFLDSLVGRLRTSSAAKAYFYNNGLGQTHLLPSFADELAGTRIGKGIDPPPAEIMFHEPEDTKGRSWCRVINGSFPVSAPMRSLLPPSSWVASFQLCLPVDAWRKGSSRSGSGSRTAAGGGEETLNDLQMRKVSEEMAEARPLVIVLPGTGEHGFERRRHMTGFPLARLGIATLILDGPFYGARKPSSQDSSRLPHLMDLCILGRATIEEGVALARWACSADLETVDGLCDFDARASDPSDRRRKLEAINRRQLDRLAAAKVWGQGGKGGTHYYRKSSSPSQSDTTDSDKSNGKAIDAANKVVDEEDASVPSSPSFSAIKHSSKQHGLMRDLRIERDRISASIAYGAVVAASPSSSSSSSSSAPSSSSSSAPHRDKGFGAVIMAGTSMGGLHAAMSASAAYDLPLGVVSWVGPPSAGGVFSLGQLAKSVDWPAIARDLGEGGNGEKDGHSSSSGQKGKVWSTSASAAAAGKAPASTNSSSSSTTSSLPARPAAILTDAVKWAASAASLDGLLPASALSSSASPVPPFDAALLSNIPPEPGKRPISFSLDSGSGAGPRSHHWDNVLEMEARLSRIDSSVFNNHSHLDDVLCNHRDMLSGVLGVDAATLASTASGRGLLDAVAISARLLRITDITNFSPPKLPKAATFVGASHDLYVPATTSLIAQWKRLKETWEGATIQSVVGGHVSACVLHSDTYCGVVVETIRRLRALQE